MNSTVVKITVIGCGWLGLPLCESLQSQGYHITTSTSQKIRKTQLDAQFKTILFDIRSDPADENLLDADVIVYTIPPLGLNEVEAFFRTLPSHQKILFISSTSVYGKASGDCSENTPLAPDSKNGKLLVESELFLRQNNKNATILRPGGLFGEFNQKLRHPVYFLQGQKDLTNGSEWLHLVDGHDCIKAISVIIKNEVWNENFNLINDLRIKKQVYYPEIAKKLGLLPPQYIDYPLLKPTKISNTKSKQILSLEYNNF